MSDTQDKIRKLAQEHKLARVNFLDKNKKIGARGRQVKSVELQFSNGEWVTCTILEFHWLGKNTTFKMMSGADWEASGLKQDPDTKEGKL